MIDGSVLQSAQRYFEKKSRVVVKMVVKRFQIQLFYCPTDKARLHRVALNFCRSLILRMGDFLCFAGTNFTIGRNCFFLLGINFWDFQEVAFHLELQHSRFLSTNNRIQVNNMQMYKTLIGYVNNLVEYLKTSYF